MRRIGKVLAGAKPMLAPLILVASIVPIAFVAVPMALREHADFQSRYLDRGPLPAPPVRLSPAAKQRFAEIPPFQDAVPVLLYHGIDDSSSPYSVTRIAFARQMAMLRAAHFHAISIGQYAAFLRGRGALPTRPVLITFDDGELSAYRGGDAILERYGMRAVMHVITSEVQQGSEYYLGPSDLQAMASSGRWDIQLHTDAGHGEIPYDHAGDTGPFYAYRAYQDGGLETFAEYKQRVTSDVEAGIGTLSEDVSGFRPESFAFPFGSFGRSGTNDPRIPGFLTHWLGARFQALFYQPSHPRFTRPAASSTPLARFEVRSATSMRALFGWLRRGAASA